jgi:threonine/homoserine/homoserine lactone efflux protein
MADSHTLLAFALTCWVFVLIPGPSVLFVISRGVTLGRRAAVLTVLGNASGILVQLLLIAAGVGAVLERSQVAYNVLRLTGAAYLVWLGIQALRHRRALSTVLDATAVRPNRQIFREGFLVGLSNPKGFVFYTAILPQFVNPDGASPTLQLLVLGAICITIAVLSDSMYGVLAGTARTWLAGRPQRLERLGGAGGLVMIGLGARLAATGRRD